MTKQKISKKTVLKTRHYFADLHDACIKEVESGDVFVNDLPSYVAWQQELKADALAGKHDGSFTFWQQAHYIQTGECIPFLSK